MISSFYSYKGGVGRTMALANVAWAYYRAGLRVLCVDGDLEAPGLDVLFRGVDENVSISHPGFLDLLSDFSARYQLGADALERTYSLFDAKSCRAVSRDLQTWDISGGSLAPYVQRVGPTSESGAELLLINAGARGDFSEYLRQLQSFTWDVSGGEFGEKVFYAWFRAALSSMADIVLVDSRTGFSDLYGVATKHLADQVVMFCAPNEQNKVGTRAILRDLATSERFPWLKKDRIPVLIVASRVDTQDTQESADFLQDFHDSVWTENQYDPCYIDVPRTNLFIPYVRAVAFGEKIALKRYEQLPPHELVVDPNDRKIIDICRSYHSLANQIARYALTSERKEVDFLEAPDALTVEPRIDDGESSGKSESGGSTSDAGSVDSKGLPNAKNENRPPHLVLIESVDDDAIIAKSLGQYLIAHSIHTAWSPLTVQAFDEFPADTNVFERAKRVLEESDLVLVLESSFYRKPYRWSLLRWLRNVSADVRPPESDSIYSEELEGGLAKAKTLRIFRSRGKNELPNSAEALFWLSIKGDYSAVPEWMRVIRTMVANELKVSTAPSKLASPRQDEERQPTTSVFEELKGAISRRGDLTVISEDALSKLASIRDSDVSAELDFVKEKLDWASTSGSARKWWEAFEEENKHRMRLVLRLALELYARGATITEFFLAYVYSNTDNILANLYYLDYTRLKKKEEQNRKEAAAAKAASEQQSSELDTVESEA